MKPEYLVEIDEHGVSCHHQDGRVDVVRWDELRAVLIETSDRGPFETDVFWILVSERGECVSFRKARPAMRNCLRVCSVSTGSTIWQ
jgi:hypothetical protein